MILQINPDLEFRLITNYLIIFLSIELSSYFLLQYFKKRNEKLPYNKILLFYSLYFALQFIASLIDTVNNFLNLNSVILILIYNIIILISPALFLLFIRDKEFSIIINLQITMILIIINLLSIIFLIILFLVNIPLLLVFRIISGLAFTYILYFQFRLVKTSGGEIQKRYKYLLVGLFFITIGFVLNLIIIQFLYQLEIINLLIIIRTINITFGFILMVLGLYNFPPFYELDWKDNLLSMFVILQSKNKCIYNYDFTLPREEFTEDSQQKMLTQGISSIESIVSKITKTKEEKIEEISQGDFLLMLDYGTIEDISLIYVLRVRKYMLTFKIFLNNIKMQFENNFKEIVSSLNQIKEDIEQFFLSFDQTLKYLMF